MESTFNLGRILGIRVGLNWTWLIVFALVVWSLATFLFPAQNPGLSTTTHWVMAAAASTLFFVSILLHELGHALQARRDGVPIEGITLWLFGGVAKFKGMYPSAAAEFRIAVAGPIVSAVIAAGLLAWAILTSMPAAVDGVVFWLGWINAIVLVFNLLPALPLDGGRILHAALWRLRQDLVWATRVGTSIGQGFGYAMIGGGILLFFFGAFITGIWLAFIGWFLIMAAQAEARHIIARERLGDLRVADLMVDEPVTVQPDLTLGTFMDEIVWEARHTTYPVVENGGRVAGLLPFRCVAEIPRREWDERFVRDCMVPRERLSLVRRETRVGDLLPELAAEGGGRALVVEDGRLVGLLSATDVAMALQSGGPRRR